MKKCSTLACITSAVVGFVALSVPAQAAVLVNYQFNTLTTGGTADLNPANMLNAGNGTGAGTISPTSANADLGGISNSGLQITAGNNLGPSAEYSLGVYNNNVIDNIPSNILYMRDASFHGTSGTGPGNAIAAGAYFDLVLTPAAGKTLSLTSLTADGRDNFGVRGMGVWASTNGVTFTQMGTDSAGWAGFDGGSWGPTAVSFDLSSLSGLTSPVTLRFGIISDAGGGAFLDNMSINGDITAGAVPEPASLSVLGLGALGVLIRRKR